MLQQRIANTLRLLADEVYPGKIPPFKVEVHAKEMRSRHGDYTASTRTIRIFNLSRDTQFIVTTAIHELSHHVDLALHGHTGHDRNFYECLRDLLAGAIRKGYVNYHVARKVTDARDLSMLERYFGDVLTSYRALDTSDGTYLIKAFKAFAVKDKLRERGYRWSDLEVAWCKEVPSEQLEEEKLSLAGLLPAEQISVAKTTEAAIEAVYHVIVLQGFAFRDQLKGRGYLFEGYGYKNKAWVRRIPAQQLAEEKQFLFKLGCTDYKVEGKKTKKAPKNKKKRQ